MTPEFATTKVQSGIINAVSGLIGAFYSICS